MKVHGWHRSGGEQSRGGLGESPAENPGTDPISSGQVPGSREWEQPEPSSACQSSQQGVDKPHHNGQISQGLKQIGHKWLQRTL